MIDDHDRLVKLDDGYYGFAAENGWEAAGESLGRTLWDFVAGDELRQLQRMLVGRMRRESRCVELPFRCDGPRVRREMSLRVAPHHSGRFVVFSARLRCEEQRPEFQPLLSASVPRGEPALIMCGWCDRFLIADAWVEVEEAANRLGLFQLGEMPALSHGVCPGCGEMLMAA